MKKERSVGERSVQKASVNSKQGHPTIKLGI